MNNHKKNSPDFTHIGDILQETLKAFRRFSDEDMLKIWDIWTETVGSVVAKNASPSAFKDRLLIVNVTSATWAQELQFLKAEMMEKLNQKLGKSVVEDIRFKVGPVGRE